MAQQWLPPPTAASAPRPTLAFPFLSFGDASANRPSWRLPARPPARLLPGVEKLCTDLKVDPSDRLVLLLAWKVRPPACLPAWPPARLPSCPALAICPPTLPPAVLSS